MKSCELYAGRAAGFEVRKSLHVLEAKRFHVGQIEGDFLLVVGSRMSSFQQICECGKVFIVYGLKLVSILHAVMLYKWK